MYQFNKDPDARLDYTVDWSPWLGTGETITSSDVVITPTGDMTSDADSADATSVTVWLLGGNVGETYTVTTRVTTNLGRTDDRSFRVVIRET